MKKFLLLGLLATVVSTQIFADVALGVKGGLDINTGNSWRIGPSIGLGNMKGSPFFIDVLMSGNSSSFTIEPTLDWHISTWNIAIVQLYLGLGVGTKFTFSTVKTLDNPLDFTLAGRIPVGVKVFLGTLEFFLEASPQFGLASHSYIENKNSHYDDDDRIYNNSFYWAVGLDVGLRIWW